MEKRTTPMMTARNILIVILLALLFGCSEYPKDTEVLKVNQEALQNDTPDQNFDITISPVNATAKTIITLRANNSGAAGGEIHWYVNGGKVAFSKGYRLTDNELKKGDVVKAEIIKGDNKYESNAIKIKNTPPVIQKAELLPLMPAATDILQPHIKAADADNDKITYTYHWTLNGNFAGEEGYLETELKRGDTIMLEVTPYDGEEYGRGVKLKSTIINSLPSVAESSPSFDGKIYTYQITATDPDSDNLSFALEKGPEGMIVDPSSGMVTWEVSPESKGIYDVIVSVSDNNGGKIHVPFQIKL